MDARTLAFRGAALLLTMAMLLGGGGGGGSSSPPPPPPPPVAAATPTFWPVAGSYSPTQMATLADATAGATVYYTTDGSAPSISSNKYASPIPVATTTTIKAIATATGFSPPAICMNIKRKGLQICISQMHDSKRDVFG